MLGLKPTSFLTTRTPEPWVETHGEKQKKSCFLRTPYGQFFFHDHGILEVFKKKDRLQEKEEEMFLIIDCVSHYGYMTRFASLGRLKGQIIHI